MNIRKEIKEKLIKYYSDIRTARILRDNSMEEEFIKEAVNAFKDLLLEERKKTLEEVNNLLECEISEEERWGIPMAVLVNIKAKVSKLTKE